MTALTTTLTNFLTLNRGAFNRVDRTAQTHSKAHAQIAQSNNTAATHIEPQQVARVIDDRPDWFQAIHDAEYYNE